MIDIGKLRNAFIDYEFDLINSLFFEYSENDWYEIIYNSLKNKDYIFEIDLILKKEEITFIDYLSIEIENFSPQIQSVFCKSIHQLFVDNVVINSYDFLKELILNFGHLLDYKLLIDLVLSKNNEDIELKKVALYQLAQMENVYELNFWNEINYEKNPELIQFYIMANCDINPCQVINILIDISNKDFNYKVVQESLFSIEKAFYNIQNSSINLTKFENSIYKIEPRLISLLTELVFKDNESLNIIYNLIINNFKFTNYIKNEWSRSYSLTDCLSFKDVDLFPNDYKPELIELINYETIFFDHKGISYADSLGLFDRLNIKLKHSPINDEKDIERRIANNSENKRITFTYPRQFFLDNEELMNQTTDFFIFNTFKGYSFFCSKVHYNESEFFNLSVPEKLDRIFGKKCFYNLIDENVDKYVNVLKKLILSLVLDTSKEQYIADFHPKAVKDDDEILTTVKSEENFGICTGPMLANIYKNKKEYFICLTPNDILSYISSTGNSTQYERWNSEFNKVFPHNCWQINFKQSDLLANGHKDLTIRMLGVGFFIIDVLINDNYNDFAKFVLNEYKKYNDFTIIDKESIINSIESSYSFSDSVSYPRSYLMTGSSSMYSVSESYNNLLNKNSSLKFIYDKLFEFKDRMTFLMQFIIKISKHESKILNKEELKKAVIFSMKNKSIYNYFDAYMILKLAIAKYIKLDTTERQFIDNESLISKISVN